MTRQSLVCLLIVMGSVPSRAQEVGPVPALIGFRMPQYPPLPRQARIAGDVKVKVRTNGTRVTDAVAEDGHPLLARAAEENVRSWRFADNEPRSFIVTYRFKIGNGPDVELVSPTEIVISAPTPEAYAVFGLVQMGDWKAELNSSGGGTFEQNMTLTSQRYTLYHQRESVRGSVINHRGEKAEIRSGELDGYQIEFTVLFGDLKIMYMGTLDGDEISGTFMESSGETGKWSAKRQRER
jgi:hypothetical protein